MDAPAGGAGLRPVWIAWGALALLFFALAAPRVGQLGLYYDEAFLAQQARDFVEPGRSHLHPASVRYVELFGRPFPTRNAAYLGALKSQLLIPVLWVFGSTKEVVRLATAGTAFVALLLAMLWAARLFGTRVAVFMGVLVATDPSFYFYSQFEWGPFTTNLLCRAGGLLAITAAWRAGPGPRRLALAGLGGAAFGLGVFSRADAALVIVAMAVGLLAGHGRLALRALKEQRALAATAASALALAALPMLLSVAALLGSSAAMSGRGDVLFRAGVLASVLDGSQFHRVIDSGGLFEAARSASAPGGLLGWALVAGVAVLGAELVAAARRDPHAAATDPRRFLLVTTLVTLLAMVLLPNAVRAHHQLNALPFHHLVVACAADSLLRRASAAGRRPLVALTAAAAVALPLANLRVIAATSELIARTEGRGRFSRALDALAAELAAEPGAAAVSLDWGFHEPLLFLTDDVPLEEAIWSIPRELGAGRPWRHAGDARTRYLVHDAPYDLFGLGPLALASARAQPDGVVALEAHRDAEGEVAFYAIRILAPHTLSYTGRFRIELR